MVGHWQNSVTANFSLTPSSSQLGTGPESDGCFCTWASGFLDTFLSLRAATTRRLLGRLFWLGVTSGSEGEVKGAGGRQLSFGPP